MIYRFAFLLILLLSNLAQADNAENIKKCEAWLDNHYQSHTRIEIIREYEEGSEYHYRANYRVVPEIAAPTSVGFDCTIYTDQGKVVAVSRLEIYPKESDPNVKAASLPEKRLKHGTDACPELDSWMRFADEIKKGNYSAKLSPSCRWLEKGERIYGPVDSQTYKNSPFALVTLPNGDRLWVEGGSL